MMAIVTLGSLLSLLACTGEWSQEPPLDTQVYLSPEQALRIIFPLPQKVEVTRLLLDPDERDRIEKAMRRRLFERGFRIYRGIDRNGGVSGYAIITEEIGKYQPITFIVGTTPVGAVRDVAVMVYRESHGGDVRRRRFLRQFVRKTTRDSIRLNRDIINITGATLSVRAIARGVRKVLHTLDACVIGGERRANLEWTALQPVSSRSSRASRAQRQARYVMGTILEAVGYGDPVAVNAAFSAAYREVARLEDLMSTYRPQSELSRVNALARERPISVSSETFECVDLALRFAERTGGAFDPTLVHDGYRAVELSRNDHTIRFSHLDLRLDLGGIAKGYALDRAARVLKAHGITQVLFNFGGQILALDPPPGADGWIVGVRHPESPEELLGCFSASNVSISTSGTYERGPHIVDPRSGATHQGRTVVFCAPTAATADALSTALHVLGVERAESLLGFLPGSALICGDENGRPLVLRRDDAPTFVYLSGVSARGGG